MFEKLTDAKLKEHKILFSIVFIALGVVATMMGINSTVTFVTGAASGFFVKNMLK